VPVADAGVDDAVEGGEEAGGDGGHRMLLS
jgi:hypothetical protein